MMNSLRKPSFEVFVFKSWGHWLIFFKAHFHPSQAAHRILLAPKVRNHDSVTHWFSTFPTDSDQTSTSTHGQFYVHVREQTENWVFMLQDIHKPLKMLWLRIVSGIVLPTFPVTPS